MHKPNVVLSAVAILILATSTSPANVFAQGFGGYVAPTKAASQANGSDTITVTTAAQATQFGIATVNTTQPSVGATLPQPVQQPRQQQFGNRSTLVNNTAAQIREVVVTPQNSQALPTQNQQSTSTQGGYVSENVENAIVPPPENYKPTPEEQRQLDEFLLRWEEFGKGVKRVSCDVHMREFDNVLQQNSKIPVAHTWGQFRYITPNKFMYHIKGEFVYSDAKPEGEWKEGQNEWMIVLNSKEFMQYDYKNKKVVVYPVVSEEQDMDLTMDNGQFPLFFVAKANVLKSRYYLRIVTPASRQKTQVWIEAFPRYARDAQLYQSITVLLNVKDLQPTYMRKVAVNGKSKTDLTFENVQVNKGIWKIEGSVEPGWSKEVREEEFSIMRQETVMPEQSIVQTPSATKQISAQGVQSHRPVESATANKGTSIKRY